MKRDFLYWVERAERSLYWTVGVALILAAAVFIAYAIVEAGVSYLGGRFAVSTIELFDRSLLALMLAQIVYTTLNFLREGVLQVEPVLVVGIIGVVRRILVLTAVVSGTVSGIGAGLSFNQIMIELGLLSLTVLVLALAIFLVRRAQKP